MRKKEDSLLEEDGMFRKRTDRLWKKEKEKQNEVGVKLKRGRRQKREVRKRGS